MRTIAFTFAVFSRFARLMGGRGRLLCWQGKEYNAHHPIIRRRRTAGVNSLAQVPFRGGNDMLRILVATSLVSIGLVLFVSFHEPTAYPGLITSYAKHGMVGVFFGLVVPVCLFAIGFFIARGARWNEILVGKWPDETK